MKRGPLWVLNYEGATYIEDGATHFVGSIPPIARQATVSDLVAVLRDEGGEIRPCARCGSTGVVSCQAFQCEHGGHSCTVCGGRGSYLIIPPYRETERAEAPA